MFEPTDHALSQPAFFLVFRNQEIKHAEVGSTYPGMNSPTAPTSVIDAELLGRVSRGDIPAFEQLYEAFSGPLYSVALRILERPEDAEDVLQEAFSKIWNEAHHFDPRRGAPLAWAITITRHKAIDRIRSLSRRLKLTEDAGTNAQLTESGPAQPGLQTEQREAAAAVKDSMAGLPSDVREAIELAYFSGLSHSQIAHKLSLPITTVKSRIRRAMQQLRQTLKNLA